MISVSLWFYCVLCFLAPAGALWLWEQVKTLRRLNVELRRLNREIADMEGQLKAVEMLERHGY